MDLNRPKWAASWTGYAEGRCLWIDRPRRLVFTFSVEKHGTDADRVSIDIVPLKTGCELTPTHEMKPEAAEYAARTQQGWAGIIEELAAVLGEGS
jgi:uncharacterized protein YndB with AHSA1/START domain